MECIKERLGELRSTKYKTIINISGVCEENILKLYKSFSKNNSSTFGDIEIIIKN